jgi:glyoxalase-like protein
MQGIAENQRPAPGELFLDHVAHFVPDLGAAARVAELLGFKVTPESAHRAQGAPAGTSNRCIMLEEGYIEILAPTLDTPHARRARDYMARYAGVHLACFGSPQAEAEHRRLGEHGFEPDPLVSLERTLEGGGKVRFKVVYVPPAKMPEGRVQYVEQLTPEAIWTEANLAHANGVTALKAIYVVADDPAETAARWARFSGLLPTPEGALVRLDCTRGRVFVGTQAELKRLLGAAPAAPGLAGYRLGCRHPEGFTARCRSLGLAVHRSPAGHAVALPASLGGVWLI